MIKKIEESPITNESELAIALEIRTHIIKCLIHQCASYIIMSLLVLALLLNNYSDYIEYYAYEYGFIGGLAVCLSAFLIGILPAFFFVYMSVKKYTPFQEEIERYENDKSAVTR